MAQAVSFSHSGVKHDKKATLPETVFGLEVPSHELVGQAYRTYLANGRSSHASVLNRGDVRGGGKKPWRQKGTGKARVGSIRVPNWRGGGQVFGPTGLENHTIGMPVKAKRLAIRQALSLRAAAGEVSIIEAFNCPDGKVNATVALLKKMNLSGLILLVVNEKTRLVERATRNIEGLKAVDAMYINVFETMNADHIIVVEQALPLIEGWLAPIKKSEEAVV
jgi:large subunit ribosomal protein L4